MKRAFISHPYADDPLLNKNLVNLIVNELLRSKDNVIPISPLHLFWFLNGDCGCRPVIMDTCYKLIDMCELVYFYVYENEFSPGQEKEYNHAREQGKKVVVYYL